MDREVEIRFKDATKLADKAKAKRVAAWLRAKARDVERQATRRAEPWAKNFKFGLYPAA